MKTFDKKRFSRSQKDDLFGWVFVLPLIIGVVLILIPVVYNSINFSFNDMKMQDVGYSLTPVGFENYRVALFVNPDFVRDILTYLSSLVVTIPSIVIFSLFIAVLLNKDFMGRTFFRLVLFIPVIMSVGYFDTVLSGDVMTSSLSSLTSFDTGIGSSTGYFTAARISEYLVNLNVTTSITNFLVSLLNGIPTIINQSGVQIIIFLAGLQSISPSVYEAAQIEGATGWESFWKITVPMISPMILVNILYSIINAFTSSSNSIMKSIQTITFSSFKFGQGAAMSWIYFSVIILVIAVVYMITRRLVFYQEGS